jgi:hypothetical protein
MAIAIFKRTGLYAGLPTEPQLEITAEMVGKQIQISESMARNLLGSESVELVVLNIPKKEQQIEIETKPFPKRKVKIETK